MDTAWSTGSDSFSRFSPFLSLALCSADHFWAPTVPGTQTSSTCTTVRRRACHHSMSVSALLPGYRPLNQSLWLEERDALIGQIQITGSTAPPPIPAAHPAQSALPLSTEPVKNPIRKVLKSRGAVTSRTGRGWGQNWPRGYRASSWRAENVLHLDLGVPTRCICTHIHIELILKVYTLHSV